MCEVCVCVCVEWEWVERVWVWSVCVCKACVCEWSIFVCGVHVCVWSVCVWNVCVWSVKCVCVCEATMLLKNATPFNNHCWSLLASIPITLSSSVASTTFRSREFLRFTHPWEEKCLRISVLKDSLVLYNYVPSCSWLSHLWKRVACLGSFQSLFVWLRSLPIRACM